MSITDDNNNNIYSHNFENLFNDSQKINGIDLLNIDSGRTKELKLEISLDPTATEKFQGQNLIFNLHIGTAFELPPACQRKSYQKIIYGTSGNDRLYGTNKNDLIIGFEGDDWIQASNGNDCLVGGPGNDWLYGSNGNDILDGGPGNDWLYGGNDSDHLFGGDGDDILKGGNANDLLEGENGKDMADGGLNLDTCFSEKTKNCEK
jgi:Ca2+-binding RTX toxin-like protein